MAAKISTLDLGGRRFKVVSAALPDWTRYGLTPAEQEVCRGLVDGLSYDEIATARGSSSRTVANQARAVFEKVGASGRLDLAARLYRGG